MANSRRPATRASTAHRHQWGRGGAVALGGPRCDGDGVHCGLMSHFFHQMGACSGAEGATGGPHVMARLDQTAGRCLFLRPPPTPPADTHRPARSTTARPGEADTGRTPCPTAPNDTPRPANTHRPERLPQSEAPHAVTHICGDSGFLNCRRRLFIFRSSHAQGRPPPVRSVADVRPDRTLGGKG